MKNLIHNIQLTGSNLKLIAILTMIIDHVGYVLFPEYIIFRIIGRVAFPIFCFLLVEGFFYTSSREKYMIRLFIFALISELPFDLCFFKNINSSYQNVFFTLFIGFLLMYCCEMTKSTTLKYIFFILAMVAAYLIHTDYSYAGIAMIFFFYYYREYRFNCFLIEGLLQFALFGWTQWFAIIALPIIALYKGKEGRKHFKYIFYTFYPLHLIVIFIISMSYNTFF